MRIVFLGTRGFPNVQGGVEKHCQELTISLVKLGCQIIVFTRSPYIDKSLKEYKGVQLVALPTLKVKSLEAFLQTFLGIFAALKFNPDILHIQAIGPALFAPLARLLGMRVVLTSHGSNYKHAKWGRFARMILRLAEYLGVVFSNEVIAVSQNIAEEIRDSYKREVHVIPNGTVLPQPLTTTDLLSNYDLVKGKYILSVGRFARGKGFEDLIKAFALADHSRFIGTEEAKALEPDALTSASSQKLVIAGSADHEDDYSRELKAMARKTKNVILTGFLTGESLQELYSHAGLFVLPSYYEGQPLVVLEAMSYGLSCVASDIPANRELGLDDERYFKAGDIPGLAGKLKHFSVNPLTEEQRQKQIRMVAEGYNWERIAGQTLIVYRRVAGSKRNSSPSRSQICGG